MHAGHYYEGYCKNCGRSTGIDMNVTICYPCQLEQKQAERERQEEAAKEDAEWRKAYKQYKKEQRRLKKQAI